MNKFEYLPELMKEHLVEFDSDISPLALIAANHKMMSARLTMALARMDGTKAWSVIRSEEIDLCRLLPTYTVRPIKIWRWDKMYDFRLQIRTTEMVASPQRSVSDPNRLGLRNADDKQYNLLTLSLRLL